MKAFIKRWYQHYQDDKTARQNALLCQGTGMSPEQALKSLNKGASSKLRRKTEDKPWFFGKESNQFGSWDH